MSKTRTWIMRMLLLCCIGGVGGVVWHKLLEDRFFPKRWREVVPGQLYASGQISGGLIEQTLRNHDIRTVIDLNGVAPDDPDQSAELEACRRLGIAHYRFPLRGDGRGDLDQYAGAIEQIHLTMLKQHPVLVHCHAGLQRSNGVVAAYRLLVRGDSPAAVYQSMLRSGWNAEENPLLIPFLNRNLDELAVRLRQRHVIEKLPAEIPQLAALPL